MKVFSFKSIRIMLLSLVLVTVFIYTQDQARETRGWYRPLNTLILPINGDGKTETAEYIQQLSETSFSEIEAFFTRQGERYQLIADRPVVIQLAPEVHSHPPEPPAQGSSVPAIMWWSLKLRWWAWRNTPQTDKDDTRIRMFVVYHQGQEGQALQHSLGLQKGLIGVVHAYARNSQKEQNNVVIAHELMHTVGASDKYGPAGHPVFPDGFANPAKQPPYPQRRAEIMAGRIAKSSQESIMAGSLEQVIVGAATAQEINWLDRK